MLSASYAHCLPSRSGDRPSDGNSSPRAPGAHPPNDSLHLRSILRAPTLLHTHQLLDPSSQQHHRSPHHSPITHRLDMYPPRQIPNSLYSTHNDSPLSLATQYARGQDPWMPRGYESRRQQYDPSLYINYHRTPRDLDDYQKRNSLPPHAFQQHQKNDHFASISDFRSILSSADVERDRQARACGQSPPLPTSYGHRLDYTSPHNILPFSYYHMAQGIRRLEEDQRQRDPKTKVEPAKPQAPRSKPHVLYSRLDKLVRHDKHRAMDHISLDDVLELHRQEAALQEKTRDKNRGKTEKRDPKFRQFSSVYACVILTLHRRYRSTIA